MIIFIEITIALLVNFAQIYTEICVLKMNMLVITCIVHVLTTLMSLHYFHQCHCITFMSLTTHITPMKICNHLITCNKCRRHPTLKTMLHLTFQGMSFPKKVPKVKLWCPLIEVHIYLCAVHNGWSRCAIVLVLTARIKCPVLI